MMLLETSDASPFAVTFVFEGIYCSAWRSSSSEPADNWVTNVGMHVGILRTAAPLYSKTWWNAERRENSKANIKRIYICLTNTMLITCYLYKWPRGTYIITSLASQTSTCLNCSAVCARPTGSDRQCRAGIMALELYSWLRTQCNALNNSFSAEHRAAARVNIVLSFIYESYSPQQ